MGMYSAIIEQNVECLDADAFVAWLEDTTKPTYLKCKERVYGQKRKTKLVDHTEEYMSYKKEAFDLWTKSTDEADFFSGLLGGRKIIGYFYESWSFFMRDLAQFFEGEITLQYEEPDVFAKLEFSDKRFFIRTAQLEYSEPMKIEHVAEIPELPIKEKMLRAL